MEIKDPVQTEEASATNTSAKATDKYKAPATRAKATIARNNTTEACSVQEALALLKNLYLNKPADPKLEGGFEVAKLSSRKQMVEELKRNSIIIREQMDALRPRVRQLSEITNRLKVDKLELAQQVPETVEVQYSKKIKCTIVNATEHFIETIPPTFPECPFPDVFAGHISYHIDRITRTINNLDSWFQSNDMHLKPASQVMLETLLAKLNEKMNIYTTKKPPEGIAFEHKMVDLRYGIVLRETAPSVFKLESFEGNEKIRLANLHRITCISQLEMIDYEFNLAYQSENSRQDLKKARDCFEALLVYLEEIINKK